MPKAVKNSRGTPVLTCEVNNTLYEPLRYDRIPERNDSAATIEMRQQRRLRLPERLSEESLNRHNLHPGVFNTIYDSALNAIGKGYDVCMGRDHSSDDAYNRLRKVYPDLKSECVVGQYRCHLMCNGKPPLQGFLHITPLHVAYVSIDPENVEFCIPLGEILAIRQIPPLDANDDTQCIRTLDLYTSVMQVLRFTDFKDVETADDAYGVVDFLWSECTSTHGAHDALPPLGDLAPDRVERADNKDLWSTMSNASDTIHTESTLSSGSMRESLRTASQRSSA